MTNGVNDVTMTTPGGNATRYDHLIIGAGPAGLQLAYFLHQAGRSYVVIEREPHVASFFRRYPRSRNLISFNKVHSIYSDPEVKLRWDWNALLTSDYSFPFRDYSKRLYPAAEEMVRYLSDFHKHFGLQVRFGSEVAEVARDGSDFAVSLADGTSIHAHSVIVATGASRPHIPDIPGIDLCEGYETASFEPDDYEGQRVLLLGKGNSAFELADAILPAVSLVHLASPDSVKLAWRTRHPGHVRALYASLLDTYQLKLLNGALDCDVLHIRKDGEQFVVTVAYLHADGETEELVYDRVIRATGFEFDDSVFAADVRPERDATGRLPCMSATWESTSVPNLFFAGTLMQSRDFRKASSAFVDGFRYNVRTLFHLLEQRFHGGELPGTTLPLRPDAVGRAMLDRVCRTSSLWAQFGFLCDAIAIDPVGCIANYYEDLPIDHATTPGALDQDEVFTISFEWGKWEGDVFNIERHPSHHTAHTNVFLHPVVRHYHRGLLQSEHHVLEDLLGVYTAQAESGTVRRRGNVDIATYHREQHEVPLRAYLAGALSPRVAAAAASHIRELADPATTERKREPPTG